MISRVAEATGTAIQAAIDEVEAAGGGTVELMPVTYPLTQPLRIKGSNVRVVGANGYARLQSNNSFRGPMVFVGLSRSLSLDTALLTGSGQSFRTGLNLPVLNLREGEGLDLDGVTSLCVEFTYRPDATDGGFKPLLCSKGTIGGTASQAFLIRHEDGGHLNVWFKCGGVDYGPIAALNAVTGGQNAHIALDYDGSTIRVWVDGVLKGSQAATGGINQATWEGVWLGNVGNAWPDHGLAALSDAPAGRIDGLRIGASRYTASFTPPTAKFSNDSSRMLLNFDTTFDGFIVGRSLGGPVYLRPRAVDVDPTTGGVEFRRLVLSGGVSDGIHAEGCTKMLFEDIVTADSMCRDAIRLSQNCFLAVLSRCRLLATNIGVSMAIACGVNAIRDSDITANRVCVLLGGGSSARLDNCYLTAGLDFGLFATGGSGSLTTLDMSFVVMSDEGQASGARAGMFLHSMRNVSAVGCSFERTLYDVPLFEVNDCDKITLYSPQIKAPPSGSANNFQDSTSGGMAAGSIRVFGAMEWPTARPRSNTANLVKYDLEA